jgi:hypothetical protein
MRAAEISLARLSSANRTEVKREVTEVTPEMRGTLGTEGRT